MFELKSFECCPTTGITSFEMHWDLGRGRKEDRGSFVDRRDAEKYVNSSKRSYMLVMYGNYVQHAQILFETGHHDFYRTVTKIEALEKCQKYNQWFQDKSLEAVCKVILAIQEDLRKILPSPNNTSFSSSESKLMDMVVFAKREFPALAQKKVV